MPTDVALAERRSDHRDVPDATPWEAKAIVRPGHDATIVNIAPGGVLIRTCARVLPGKRVELQLLREGVRHVAAGRVLRCGVIALGPLSYAAAIEVENDLCLGAALNNPSVG